MKKVGFIGVGIMGSRMVKNLIKNGYDVNIYARNRNKVQDVISSGAFFFDTIKDCVKKCDAVITMVGYPSDVKDIYFDDDGIINSSEKGAYLIDMTTTSPEIERKIYDTASPLGFHVLDAPVTGGVEGAEKGTLSILAGGNKKDFDACKELFSAMGKSATYYGPSGCGQHAKLANQIIQAGTMAGICEGISYALTKGLDMKVFGEGAHAGAGESFLLDSYYERICNEDLAPGFFIDFFIKDMKLAEDSAIRDGLNLNVLHQVLENYQALSETGDGKLGMQGLIKYYE